MKNMIALVKLELETRGDLDEIKKDIPGTCIDNLDRCNIETLQTWEDTSMNRVKAKAELVNCKNEAYEVGRNILLTGYVLEYYKADDNGEFVDGSDYDY